MTENLGCAASEACKRVVLLGTRGFVARELGAFLRSEGSHVRGISSQECDLVTESASETLSALLEPGDALVFIAALTPDKGRDVATFMKNLRMAENLCRVLTVKSCGHLIYISSDAVYPSVKVPISEQLSCSPTDLYSLMHIAREKMLAQVALEQEIPLCILRPCAIYGASDTHNSYGPNRFIRSALAGGKIQLFGDGEERRDHVYIADVVRVISLVLRDRTTGVLNVVSGAAVSFMEVAELIREYLGRHLIIETIPRNGPVVHREFDPTELLTRFPEFRPTELKQGIAEAIAAYQR